MIKKSRKTTSGGKHMFKHLLIGVSLLGFGVSASAANFPTQPIEIVVPYAAGGVADNIARHIAKNMTEDLDQSVVVINKPGGNTVIGSYGQIWCTELSSVSC